MRVRPANPGDAQECSTIVERMQATLVEVLGSREAAEEVHSLSEIEDRLAWHLDRVASSQAQVFVSESADGRLLGHCIVRVDTDNPQQGVFATSYVVPEARRHKVASQLLTRGEQWMVAQGLVMGITFTDPGNARLQRLFLSHGYRLEPAGDEKFVRLAKALQV